MAAVNGEIASDKCSKQKEAVFVKSNVLHDSMNKEVRGYDFNQGVDYSKILSSYSTIGFQATALALAIEEIKRMIKVKYEPSVFEDALDTLEYDSYSRKKTGCTIFLGYTSNMISCGIRECIRFLVQHNMVDCIVTSAGGVEEDFIKCLAPTYLGDFGFTGSDLRKNGINRIGNLLVPNDNYCKFEDWVLPIFDEMLNEQKSQNMKWTPSKLIRRLGQKINNENSVYYWAYKNNIPVFCPGLTDGSLGDMLYFYSYKNPGLTLDIIEDVRLLNDTAVHSEKTGIIILGGGLIKHHICNANLMRNGAEFAVFVNTAQEFDGSDSGAQPDEAVSWGKIKIDAKPVKVHCDASIVFPLIVAETFAKFYHSDLKPKIS